MIIIIICNLTDYEVVQYTPAYATAYEAEAVAIYIALNYLKTLSNDCTRVKLLTDSLSNMRAIGSRNNRPSLTIKNQLLALQCGDKLQLSIEWIAGSKAASRSKNMCSSLLECSLVVAERKVNIMPANQRGWKQSSWVWTKPHA